MALHRGTTQDAQLLCVRALQSSNATVLRSLGKRTAHDLCSPRSELRTCPKCQLELVFGVADDLDATSAGDDFIALGTRVACVIGCPWWNVGTNLRE